MAVVNPLRNPEAFDVIKLAGRTSPGLCEVTGGHAPRKIDVRKGYGLTGATTVFTGIDVDGFQVRLRMWTEEQIDEYNTNFVPLLALPPSGKASKALEFYHPLVSEPPIGVRSVLVHDPAQLIQTEDGVWVVDIKFMPFRPPTPQLAKPAAAATTTKATPKDAADRIIENLTAQVKALG